MAWRQRLAETLVETPRLRGVLPRRAVVMILLSGDGPDPEMVFEVRANGIPQSGEIGFPGGKVDPLTDKTVADTALREASEELGVPSSAFQVLGRMDSLLTRWGLQIDVVVCHTALRVSEFQPSPDEVARVFGLRLSWLRAQTPEIHRLLVQSHPVRTDPQTGEQTVLFPAKSLDLPERYHQPWGDTITNIYAYRSPEGVVWGITGDILHDFLARYETAGQTP